MAGQPDISSILAALAAQRPAGTPSQIPQPPQQQNIPQGYPGSLQPQQPQTLPGYALPQPTSSGSLDLNSIKPVNSGSVSIAEAIAKARGIAAEKGLSYENRGSAAPAREDPRLAGRAYRRSRSRSRSPPARQNFRDNYNPYRDERRDEPRRSGTALGRERSLSPGPRARGNFSPPSTRAYGTRDRSPRGDGENVETILIESSLVGLIIGRQGENLRRVEQDSGTRVQFVTGPDVNGPQRQCKITGPARARAEAKREINRIIEDNGIAKGLLPMDRGTSAGASSGRGGASKNNQQPALREGENASQIMVPDRTVGLIIGRGGETIRDLQERSGCHVNIVGENKSVNGLRPVNLIGNAAAAARAKELILEIVESDNRGQAGNGPPPSRDMGRGAGGYDSYSGGDNQGAGGGAGGGKINDKIFVPSEAVGMIIGKGGETIKEMQNQTGCKINVSQPSGADVEREIGLVGTQGAIEEAKRAIWDKVDTVTQRDRNGGQGGNRGRAGADPYSDNRGYSQQPQQGYGQQPYGQQAQVPAPVMGMQQQGAPSGAAPTGDPAAAGAASGAADPYAAWGGYQNYMAMWYAALAQQSQAQGGQPPPGAQ
ncbi:hypothetical protein BJ546DRAFT_946400 [Cryomyces antarcticus]|nr:hypothetical protein LTR04_003805 [Oleoguttula sp. CCFEE 6159]